MKRFELYSAAFGAVICLALFVCSCVAKEFTARDSIIPGFMAAGCGIGWYRLRKANCGTTKDTGRTPSPFQLNRKISR
jgi:hypothetical protein